MVKAEVTVFEQKLRQKGFSVFQQSDLIEMILLPSYKGAVVATMM